MFYRRDRLVMRDEIEAVSFKIEPAKRGNEYTLYLQKDTLKQYIFSRYNPREDALKMLEEDLGNKQSIWIIFGFAFGYVIDEIMTKVSDESRIIVIEPNETLLNEQLKVTQKEWLKERENIHFFCGDDFIKLQYIIKQVIPEEELNNMRIVYTEKYIGFYKGYYKAILEILDEAVTSKLINRNTIIKYAKTFFENIISNREYIRNSYDLSVYKEKYKNMPGLIVSGGPSLSKNIKFIKEFKGVIFTGTRTLTAILDEGVKPDFLVSVDPTDKIYQTLMENTENDISLITLDQSNHKVIASNKGRQYFIPTEKIAEELLGTNLEVNLSRGGSVATLCLSAAQYMGCNPIIFIGQDLANTDMKLHADICSNERNGLGNNEVIDEGDLINRGYKQIDGYDGEKVWSSSDLIYFLRWIEEFVECFKEIKFINATEGGAFIRGTINKRFKEVTEEYSNIQKIHMEDMQRQPYLEIDVEENIIKALDKLEKLKDLAKEAKDASEKLKKEYTQYEGRRNKKIRSLLNKIDKIEKKILTENKVKSVVEDLFDSAYYFVNCQKEQKEAINESEQDKNIRITSYNYNVYEALVGAIEEVIKIIKESLELHIEAEPL